MRMKKLNKEDTPTNATGSSVVGTGDNAEVWKKKKCPKGCNCPKCKGTSETIVRRIKKKLKGTYEVGRKPDPELVIKKEDRNYRKEYDNYHAQPEQREKNAARLRARRLMVKKGKVKKNDKMDVHHKDNNPLNNDPKNLSVTTQKYNRTEPRLRGEDVDVAPTPDSTFASMPVFSGTKESVFHWLNESKLKVLGTSSKGTEFIHNFTFDKPAAIVMGSESHGLGSFWAKNISGMISIPLYGRASSLNLNCATACVLMEFNRQTKCTD